MQPKIFLSYSHADTKWMRELDPFLAGLAHYAQVNRFDDRQLLGGEGWNDRIKAELDQANIILLLITANFIGSAYIHAVELPKALQRRKEEHCVIMPILFENCHYKLLGIERNNYLPKDQEGMLRPVSKWQGVELADALTQIVENVDAHITRLSTAVPTRPITSPVPLVPDGDDQPGQKLVPFVGAEEPKGIPTLTVAMAGGPYRTINDAVRDAPRGARLLIMPGLYQESLTLEKPLELLGVGQAEEIILEDSASTTLTVDTNLAVVRNLTMRQVGEKNYCVWIKQGRLELEHCQISSEGLACIAVSGAAEPRVRHNRIHSGRRGGVFIYDGGGGIFEDNNIFGHSLSAVAARTKGSPIFRRNKIYDNKQSGVYIWERGRGFFEDNDIFHNMLAGVQVKEQADPEFRHNRIYNGKQAGIFIYEAGRGTFVDNDIFENAHCGVAVRTGAYPILHGNRISRNGHHAVAVWGGGAGEFKSNLFEGNRRGSWYVTGDSAGRVNRQKNKPGDK